MQNSKKTPLDLYIIDKVKQMRIAHGISQAVLATKLEVSNAFIGQIEDPNHSSKYNVNHINKLAKIFICSPKDFLPEDPI
jgi:transcriptional regulator with XRE-family HTH domain